jgi:hypothetical protein
MKEKIISAAIARLASVGEIKIQINPNIGKDAEKSVYFFINAAGFASEPDIGIEIINFPFEKIVFWVDGAECEEAHFAATLDAVENLLGE